MPANDGTPRTWYSLIEYQNNILYFQNCELHYSYKETRQKMQCADISSDYIGTLKYGVWPSEEVLPEHEKSQCGIKLQPTRFDLKFKAK